MDSVPAVPGLEPFVATWQPAVYLRPAGDDTAGPAVEKKVRDLLDHRTRLGWKTRVRCHKIAGDSRGSSLSRYEDQPNPRQRRLIEKGRFASC